MLSSRPKTHVTRVVCSGTAVTQFPACGELCMEQGASGSEAASPESSSCSSQSLLSRHLHSLQNQVRLLQQELASLKDSDNFACERLDNLEHISRSLSASVQDLSNQILNLERTRLCRRPVFKPRQCPCRYLLDALQALSRPTFEVTAKHPVTV